MFILPALYYIRLYSPDREGYGTVTDEAPAPPSKCLNVKKKLPAFALVIFASTIGIMGVIQVTADLLNVEL